MDASDEEANCFRLACDLFPGELVVGKIVVEGLDDPVAIGPGIAAGFVVLKAVALSVASDIEPVACPAFAVIGRGEKVVDDGAVVCVRGVSGELLQKLGAWRQPDEIEREPAG